MLHDLIHCMKNKVNFHPRLIDLVKIKSGRNM